MGSNTMTAAPESLRAPAKVRAGHREVGKARAALAMSLATFAMAVASGIQAILYLGRFGTNARTDGFFVAFALYSTFGVFSQSLRLTSVPLLVEPGARLSVRQFAQALLFIALPVLMLTIPLAVPLSRLIAPGLRAGGQEVTASALPVLGCAMTLQLWAAGGATVLAIRDRFATIAGAYISGAGAGLIVFLALIERAGEVTLGWSMLAMAIVTCAWMLEGLRRAGGLGNRGAPLALRAIPRNAGVILGRTAVYLAFNVLFVITLAFASHSATGGTTVLSYAYLFASYLVAGTGMALGMSSIPDMTRQARAERQAVIAGTVLRGFRYAMLLIAPALAGLVVAGAPLIHALLPGSLSAGGVHTLRTFALLLVTWTVAALLVNFLLPAMFAIGRAGLLNVLSLPLVAGHLAVTAVAAALFGVDGAVGAFFVAPACFAAVLLRAGAGSARAPRLAWEMCGDASRFLALAAIAFGAGWASGDAVPGGLAQAGLAGLIGCGIYAVGLRLLAPSQLRVLARALVTRPEPA